MKAFLFTAALFASVQGLACTPTASSPDCEGGGCEETLSPLEKTCEARRADAFNSEQPAFTENRVRWACKDAEGIDRELKGQEYCESFAILNLDGMPAPRVVGKPLRYDPNWDLAEFAELMPEDELAELEASEWNIDINDSMRTQLETLGVEQAASCIFTSWHSDVGDADASSSCGSNCSATSFEGIPLDASNFAMLHPVNSREAAANLVEDCLQKDVSIARFNGDSVDDAFTRGCMLNELINRTSYRKSDSNICSAAMRLAECGCKTTQGLPDFHEVLRGGESRGFPLSSWNDEKPAGCEFLDSEKTIMSCSLTGNEVLENAHDLKAKCDEKYGANVVVNVKVDGAFVECTPDSVVSFFADETDYAQCGFQAEKEQWTPWMLEDRGASTTRKD